MNKVLQNLTEKNLIAYCGTPTEKASEFFDLLLKSVMENGASILTLLTLIM